MAGKTTYYRRLQVILELSASEKPSDKEAFLAGINRKSPPNFVYHRWDPKRKERVGITSSGAILGTFNLAVRLGIIEEETGRLTSVGKEAADQTRFDIVITKQLDKIFKLLGFSITKIEEESGKMLRKNDIVLPTADKLYVSVFDNQEPEISILYFRTLMRLLAACGGINTSRRQLYLPKK